MADSAGTPPDRPRLDELPLAPALRRRDRRHSREFRRQRRAPSRPKLLDWLATEFVAQGWSVKAMHRLIMTTDAYRQSSYDNPDRHALAHQADPDNRLPWR